MIGLSPWGAILTGLKFFAKTKEQHETLDEAQSILSFARNTSQKLNTTSVAESAARSLISPMVVFEESLMYQEYMQDLITIVNLRDIRDTLTHLSLEGTVGGVKISKLVNSINPNRSAGFMSLQGCEAVITAKGSIFEKAREFEKEKITIDSNDVSNLTEYAPLALGRVVKATSLIDKTEVNFFLTFRQIPIAASTKDLKLVFTAAEKGTGWLARFKEYRAGGITRPELLKGTDTIKREFNIRNNDMSGYYTEAMRREKANIKETLSTGVISVNTMANTIILTKETADEIELDIGMRFNSPNIKSIRKYVNANTIVIVNDARGIFEFHTVGNPFPVKYTLSQIKSKSKKEDTGSLESLIKLLSGN